jgi:hypothetical protein
MKLRFGWKNEVDVQKQRSMVPFGCFIFSSKDGLYNNLMDGHVRQKQKVFSAKILLKYACRRRE